MLPEALHAPPLKRSSSCSAQESIKDDLNSDAHAEHFAICYIFLHNFPFFFAEANNEQGRELG